MDLPTFYVYKNFKCTLWCIDTLFDFNRRNTFHFDKYFHTSWQFVLPILAMVALHKISKSFTQSKVNTSSDSAKLKAKLRELLRFVYNLETIQFFLANIIFYKSKISGKITITMKNFWFLIDVDRIFRILKKV